MSPADAAALPAAPGAYALDLRLAGPLDLAIATLGSPRLAAGRYVYVGSARGPGGIRARVGRHLAADKARRWHVDHLTGATRVTGVVGRPGANECDLVRSLLAGRHVRVAVPGFGSSDCTAGCPAHLVAIPEDLDLEAVL